MSQEFNALVDSIINAKMSIEDKQSIYDALAKFLTSTISSTKN
jgi:hypothetical protein